MKRVRANASATATATVVVGELAWNGIKLVVNGTEKLYREGDKIDITLQLDTDISA